MADKLSMQVEPIKVFNKPSESHVVSLNVSIQNTLRPVELHNQLVKGKWWLKIYSIINLYKENILYFSVSWNLDTVETKCCEKNQSNVCVFFMFFWLTKILKKKKEKKNRKRKEKKKKTKTKTKTNKNKTKQNKKTNKNKTKTKTKTKNKFPSEQSWEIKRITRQDKI